MFHTCRKFLFLAILPGACSFHWLKDHVRFSVACVKGLLQKWVGQSVSEERVQEFSKVNWMSVSFRCSQNARATKWTKIFILCTLEVLKGTNIPHRCLHHNFYSYDRKLSNKVVALMEISFDIRLQIFFFLLFQISIVLSQFYARFPEPNILYWRSRICWMSNWCFFFLISVSTSWAWSWNG